MPVTTYAELKAAIGDFLDRSDMPTGTFVALAEAQINRDIRHWRMEKRKTTTFNEAFEELPTDWVETIRVSVGDYRLDQRSAADMAQMQEHNNATARPRYYAHVAGNLELYPRPDQDYTGTLLYRAKIPALSDSNTTNWLLDDFPDVYLYGALIHSSPYLVEDGRSQVWGSLYSAAVQNANMASDAARHSGPLAMRIRAYG